MAKGKKQKTTIKRPTSDSRTIQTSLIGKEEVFRMIALAEATQMCLLLQGPPGTGKTKTVVEYAKSWLLKDGKTSDQLQKDFVNKLFILETDESTRGSEVKGIN